MQTFSPGLKQVECETDHSTPTCVKAKNEHSYTAIPHTRSQCVQGEAYLFQWA